MVSCYKCRNKPVIVSSQAMCRKHFIAYFEDKVKRTIRKFGLVERKQKIVVAASGGKDSTALLYIIHKLGFDVDALAIDEGINGYRDLTLNDLRGFCKKHNIKLKIVSFKDSFGFSLDELLTCQKLLSTKSVRFSAQLGQAISEHAQELHAVSFSPQFLTKKQFHPCMACGILRRNALNKAARDYDVIATGHNLDDEAQSFMMNLAKANVHLLPRLGPKTGQVLDSRFTPRVKPLYFCSEKEVATYAFLQGFSIKFTECPNASKSFRASIRDLLNDMEAKHPGTKLGIVNSFLKMLPFLKKMPLAGEIVNCSDCGEPSSKALCSACSISREFTISSK